MNERLLKKKLVKKLIFIIDCSSDKKLPMYMLMKTYGEKNDFLETLETAQISGLINVYFDIDNIETVELTMDGIHFANSYTLLKSNLVSESSDKKKSAKKILLWIEIIAGICAIILFLKYITQNP